ncbi:MAG TPA: hypothetical protein VHM64_06530 [Candidatus Binatia bacterium]|nr:hypothetical protein [Candidatus Binatia bacterium]
MTFQNTRQKQTIEDTGNAFDRVSSLFQADTLAAQQYQDTYRRKIPQQPEIRLMLAVLEDAINCYQDNVFATNKKRVQLFKEAEEWFMSDDASWIFSFVSVCSILNLEPDYFRMGVRRWAAKQKSTRKNLPRDLATQDRLVA